MERLELVESVARQLMDDKQLLEKLQNFSCNEPDAKINDEQEADQVYLLAAKLPVMGESQTYHYFLLIKDCILKTEYSENTLYAAHTEADALWLLRKLSLPGRVNLAVMKVSASRFDVLKRNLDATLEILKNEAERKARCRLKQAGEAEGELDSIVREALAIYLLHCQTVIGGPLLENGEPVPLGEKAEYDIPYVKKICEQAIENYRAKPRF